jgi:hypothetical protein
MKKSVVFESRFSLTLVSWSMLTYFSPLYNFLGEINHNGRRFVEKECNLLSRGGELGGVEGNNVSTS